MTTSKKLSESHAAEGVSFNKNTSIAVSKGFTKETAQEAIEEAKPGSATTAAKGVVQKALQADIDTGTDTDKYVPVDLYVDNLPPNTIPTDHPEFNKIPVTIYGGSGSSSSMITTFDSGSPRLPKGSIIVFEQQYTYQQGTGNGTTLIHSTRRRSIVKTSTGGWELTTVEVNR